MQPPGGASSDLFGGANDLQPTPRKVINRQQSDIFGPQNGHTNGHTPKPKADKTFDRLFGENDKPIKQKEKPYLASTLSLEDTPTSPSRSPAKTNGSQPGSPIGSSNGSLNGSINGDGHANGSNGSTNGHKTPDLVDGAEGKSRIPPGGFSSKLW